MFIKELMLSVLSITKNVTNTWVNLTNMDYIFVPGSISSE